MNTHAIIFDVDGVLVDTIPMHFSAWKNMFESEGIPFSFSDYQNKVNGLPRLTGIANIMPHASKEKLLDCAEKKQQRVLTYLSAHTIRPLPGVISLLQTLQQKQVLLVAASSSKNVSHILNSANLTHFFASVISGNDFTHSKPNPDIFLTAAQSIHMNAESCIVVEDAFLGIQAGKNAHMKTVSVFTSQDTKAHQHADLALSSLKEKRLFLEFITHSFQ